MRTPPDVGCAPYDMHRWSDGVDEVSRLATERPNGGSPEPSEVRSSELSVDGPTPPSPSAWVGERGDVQFVPMSHVTLLQSTRGTHGTGHPPAFHPSRTFPCGPDH